MSDEVFAAVLEAHPAAVAAPCPFLVEGCPNALHAVLWMKCGAARVEAVMRAWPEVGV